MKPAFPEIGKIPYEGPSSKNPLAFKHYDPTKVIEGRTNLTVPTYSVTESAVTWSVNPELVRFNARQKLLNP